MKNNQWLTHAICVVSVLLLSLQLSPIVLAQEQDVIELSTTVTGNQEQPKVLYIVPWKQADDTTILYQPINSQANRVFGHVERSEHKRQLKFIKDMEAGNSSK